MSCPNCGMYLPTHPIIWEFGEEPYAIEGPVWHECPDPFDPDTARFLFDFHSRTGIPVSSRTKARIALGLEASKWGRFEVEKPLASNRTGGR